MKKTKKKKPSYFSVERAKQQALTDTQKYIQKIQYECNLYNLKQPYYQTAPQTIYSFDFVVRTNTFKCYHSDHKLKDLVGVLDVRKFDGQLTEQEVQAAYCEECDCYFVCKDEFDKLALIGEPLCNVLETETYYKEGLYHSSNYFSYAGRSILMENGYNVRAGNGLTDIERQNILADLVDKNITSAFNIKCLIQSFIAQKECLSQYDTAIEKWKADMEFISSYNSDKKERVYVNSIKRNIYKKKT